MTDTDNTQTSEGKKARGGVFLAYLPAIVSLVLTILTLVLYQTTIPNHYYSLYLGLAVAAITPFALVFFNRIWKLGIPQYLIILLCLHMVLSIDMGSTLGFYRILWWDSASHTMFGFLTCAVFYYLYFRLKKGEKPGIVDYIVMVLLVLSVASIWEVYEYVASFIFKSDMQDVERLLAEGKHPLSDTIADMCLATLGAVIFPILLFLKERFIDRRKIRWVL